MEVSRNVKGSLWESINVLSPKLCFFWSIIVPPHLCHHCTAISCAYVPHPSIQPYPHCNICIVSLYPVKQICSLVSVGIHEESFSSINARQHPTRASQPGAGHDISLLLLLLLPSTSCLILFCTVLMEPMTLTEAAKAPGRWPRARVCLLCAVACNQSTY